MRIGPAAWSGDGATRTTTTSPAGTRSRTTSSPTRSCGAAAPISPRWARRPARTASKVAVPTGAWHTLRVDFAGAEFDDHLRRPAPVHRPRRHLPRRRPGGDLVQGRQRHRVRTVPTGGSTMSTDRPFSSSACTARPRASSPPPTSGAWPPSAASTSPPTRPAPSRIPRSPPAWCAALRAEGRRPSGQVGRDGVTRGDVARRRARRHVRLRPRRGDAGRRPRSSAGTTCPR